MAAGSGEDSAFTIAARIPLTLPLVRPHVLSLLTFLAAAPLLAAPLAAQSGGYRAAPSTRATAEVSLTLADTAAQRAAGAPKLLRIDYGQPHLRGRRINTDALVPLGTVWRLGANAATLLTADVDLMLGDQRVPKGRYVMMALPEAGGWTLILQAETTGAASVMVGAYDQARDFARIRLSASTAAESLESLHIALVPAAGDVAARGTLQIGWDRVRLSAPWQVP